MRFQLARFAAILLAIVACCASNPVRAQERSAVRQGFSLPADGSARIAVVRPRVSVGAQSTGGSFEPNAEWTDQARTNLDAALASELGRLGSQMLRPEITPGAAEQLVSEYNALFEIVARSVIEYQFFVGNRLETKKRDNREGVFDWSLGTGTSSLPFTGDADYALFIVTNDHYGSTGRKILQIFSALAVGYSVQSGIHAGYAGLVDLRTGNLVWINADNAMGGDVRTQEGAARRVQQLLEGFPGSQPAVPSAS